MTFDRGYLKDGIWYGSEHPTRSVRRDRPLWQEGMDQDRADPERTQLQRRTRRPPMLSVSGLRRLGSHLVPRPAAAVRRATVRMSLPLDLGYWSLPNGQRRLLVWWPDTGAVILGDEDVLAVVHDEDDLRRRLEAWPEHCDLRDGLGWVAQQLEGCR